MKMVESDDDKRQRKSRKHDGSGRSKHRSSRDNDRDRHRDRDSDRHKERDRDSRDRNKSGRGKDKDDGRSSRDSKKLTEEEERLYAKARKYVEQEGKDSRRQKHDHHHGKDSKRRRSESYDSSDGDANASREGKRHRSHRKEHKRSSKKDYSHGKSRHKKKSKHDHREEEKHGNKKKHGSKSVESFKDKASKIDSSKLVALGDSIQESPIEQLDPKNNYFSHNSHLRLYLYREFGIYFEDLDSSESHDAFDEFTKAYNAGKLERAYYDSSGILPQDALDQCSRTKHQWKFRTNRVEERSLEMVRAGVKKQTEYNDKAGTVNNAAAATGKKSISGPINRSKSDRDADNAQRRRTPQEIAAQRQSDKHHRDRIKLANEEIHGVGKADQGWERTREKKREQSEKLHGAARDRDEGGAELDDDAIYGSTGGGRRGRGEGTYEEAVAKQRQYRERKEAEKAARTSELLKKEEEKKQKMLDMLGLSGLKAGQKIKIAPRNDAA